MNTTHPIDHALALLLCALEGVCWLINEALGFHTAPAAPAPVLALPAATRVIALLPPAPVLAPAPAPKRRVKRHAKRLTMAQRYARTSPAELVALFRQAESWKLTDRQLAHRKAKAERLAAQDAAAMDWIAAGSPEPVVYAAKPADVRRNARDLDRHAWACEFMAWYAKQPASKRPVRMARRARRPRQAVAA